MDEACTTHGRAVGLPEQHSFCIFLGCSRLLYIGTQNGVDWWHGRAHAAKQFQFKSPRPCCLRRIDTAQTWGNEPWSTELWFYSRPLCHKIFIGATIIIFRYEYKQLISINVFNPVDPKIFYFIYLLSGTPRRLLINEVLVEFTW